jgi:hypothetical protein
MLAYAKDDERKVMTINLLSIRIYDFDKRFKMATRANSGILLAEP